MKLISDELKHRVEKQTRSDDKDSWCLNCEAYDTVNDHEERSRMSCKIDRQVNLKRKAYDIAEQEADERIREESSDDQITQSVHERHEKNVKLEFPFANLIEVWVSPQLPCV